MREKLIELLDTFNRDLSKYAGDSKFILFDDNVEVADFLIANGVTLQKWIPVSERLPEDDLPKGSNVKQIKVLAVLKSWNGNQTVRSQMRYRDTWGKEIKWMWKYSSSEVTHWMPLPDAPEGE